MSARISPSFMPAFITETPAHAATVHGHNVTTKLSKVAGKGMHDIATELDGARIGPFRVSTSGATHSAGDPATVDWWRWMQLHSRPAWFCVWSLVAFIFGGPRCSIVLSILMGTNWIWSGLDTLLWSVAATAVLAPIVALLRFDWADRNRTRTEMHRTLYERGDSGVAVAVVVGWWPGRRR